MPRVSTFPPTPASFFDSSQKQAIHIAAHGQQPFIPASAKIDFMPPVRDQGAANVCSAFPVCALASRVNLTLSRPGARVVGGGVIRPVVRGPHVPVNEAPSLSTSHLIDQASRVQGLCGSDPTNLNFPGLSLGTLMRCAMTNGIVNEVQWPYDPNASCRNPAPTLTPPLYKIPNVQALYQEARGSNLSAVYVTELIKFYVAMAKLPVIVSVPIFWSSGWLGGSGAIVMPPAAASIDGWHAIAVTGYSDTVSAFNFQNSWGDWGTDGYGTLPYAYVNQYSDLAVVAGSNLAPAMPLR